jgi:hypothetical protein
MVVGYRPYRPAVDAFSRPLLSGPLAGGTHGSIIASPRALLGADGDFHKEAAVG